MSRPAILMVDDERTILTSLKSQLRGLYGARYSYEAAESVAEAWEIIDELLEDGVTVVVIVSDWLMPGIRGDAFLEEVRAKHPGIVRILLTGQADPQVLHRVVEQQLASRVLHKPWTAHDLDAAIKEGLERE